MKKNKNTDKLGVADGRVAIRYWVNIDEYKTLEKLAEIHGLKECQTARMLLRHALKDKKWMEL